MKKKALLLLFLTILCVNTLLLASCSNSNGNDNNGGTGDYVMQIPMKPILCVAPIHIAHELGYFTEEGLKYETYNTGASDYDLITDFHGTERTLKSSRACGDKHHMFIT